MQKAKAVIFDIDGTLSLEASWLALTRDLGASVADHERIYNDYKQGHIDYDTARAQLVSLWKATGKATKHNFETIFKKWALDPHAEHIIELARRDNREICLITGSMDLYAQIVAKRLGIAHWYANTTLHWDRRGNLVGIDYDIDQADKKLDQFNTFCRTYDIKPFECVVIGDDEIDMGMFAASRRGILVGQHPPEQTQKAWKAVSKLGDVAPILNNLNELTA